MRLSGTRLFSCRAGRIGAVRAPGNVSFCGSRCPSPIRIRRCAATGCFCRGRYEVRCSGGRCGASGVSGRAMLRSRRFVVFAGGKTFGMFRREVRIRFARPGFENPLREDRLLEAGAGGSPVRDTICRGREVSEFAAARCRDRISAISLLFLTKCVHRKQRRDVAGALSGFTAFPQGSGAEVRSGACRAGCSFGKCGAKRRECGRSVRGKRAVEFVRRGGYRLSGRPHRGASPADVRSVGGVQEDRLFP